MAGQLHSIKQGDTEPVLRVILKDVDGTLALIQGGDVVTFRATPQIKGLRADISGVAHVNDPNAGDVEWRPIVADTTTPGLYDCEFHIDYATGSKKTFPTEGYVTLEIEHRAAAT